MHVKNFWLWVESLSKLDWIWLKVMILIKTYGYYSTQLTINLNPSLHRIQSSSLLCIKVRKLLYWTDITTNEIKSFFTTFFLYSIQTDQVRSHKYNT